MLKKSVIYLGVITVPTRTQWACSPSWHCIYQAGRGCKWTYFSFSQCETPEVSKFLGN